MKKKIAVLLIAVISLFSMGIMTSCSCNGGSGNAEVEKTNYTTSEALEDTVNWIMKTYTKGDRSVVEKNLKYTILPSSTNSPCFVRYTLSYISARDLLVFKGGEVIVIDDDSLEKAKSYNNLFTVDITKVTDDQLKAQPKVVSGSMQ